MKYLISLIFLTLSCAIFAQETEQPTMYREMRGVWVASVANIDWPSERGLDEATLKKEADVILDRSVSMGLNTVFLQVRPSSDVIYKSSLEPLSFYLVGSNFSDSLSFDPLEYWIQGAHRRGLELHAWINPFRVTPKADYPCAENHISKTHPEWTIKYAGKLYLNPGLPVARDYVRNVVMDVVARYDIDGIHFDDYFYPYPSKGEVFDDSSSFADYNPDHLTRDNWRRSNVTAVIRAVSDSIRASKPWVQFGVSPFGVWRNKRDDATGSNTVAGITNYDILYADVMDWIDKSLVDYVVPQIYWEAGNKWCDFDVLEQWWGEKSTKDTKIFVGHAVFKINDGKKPNVGWNNKKEMPNQMAKVRSNERLDGSVFFSYRQFNRNILGFEEFLSDDFYKDKALQVTLDKGKVEDITISKIERDGSVLQWKVEGDTANVRFYVVFRTLRKDVDNIGSNESILCFVDRPYISVPITTGRRQRYVYRVAAVDKYRVVHELSRRITVRE